MYAIAKVSYRKVVNKLTYHYDLTFFTNEPERNLYDRFSKILISNTQFFDVLVGYFQTSGFFMLYPAMEGIEKIRILVGLNVDWRTIEIIKQSKEDDVTLANLSHKEAKDVFSKSLENEFNMSDDAYDIEQGVKVFIEWLKNGKIELRMYPEQPIHAKVYIMRKDPEKVPDQYGSVITGSSNFSMAGLKNNLEFNVELKDGRDVQFALDRFEELWKKSVDISEVYIDTVTKNTWIRDDITPYELYLKTLYEYFKEEINQDKNEMAEELLPDGYMKLQYQLDAVTQAKKILDAYDGVFISDVVGLGKTYICAMLAKSLKGKKLIICPPVLIDYWEKVMLDFDVAVTVESLGKLEKLIESGVEEYKYVFIDEAHRFRNQDTESFKLLHQICYNKKVILITATPQNNYSRDIENQIYLFQPRHNSTIIPNVKNLEAFFARLEASLKKTEKGSPQYIECLRRNSEIIRDKILRNIMIRRTRKEIVEYYADDLKKRGLKFPELGTPEKIIYTFDDDIEDVFNETIGIIKTLDYARYAPLTYLKNVDKKYATMMVAQRNMSGFMKSILVKRLESSFYAFKMTLSRFIESYERFIQMCEQGEVFISKKVNIYDLLDNGDDEKLMELVESGEVQHFSINEFKPIFIPSLKRDLSLLKQLKVDWDYIKSDPKAEQFEKELKENPILRGKKIIVFTESKETAVYIGERLEVIFPGKVIVFTGESSKYIEREIENNFNPSVPLKYKQDKYNILVTTDILAEGMNLHRSNVIINYDLPWNPTKIIQRVGRINRVGTEHDEIFVFNFFPTAQANAHLPLEENIMQKIQAFHDTLGEDFKYLSDDEQVTSHKLYRTLASKESLESEEEGGNPELGYLNIIRQIRDNDQKLFEKIKRLPLKAKTGRRYRGVEENAVITFLKKGSLKMFFFSNASDTKEMSFIEAIQYLKAEKGENKAPILNEFYKYLEANKNAFDDRLKIDDEIITQKIRKSGNDAKMLRLLKAISKCKSFTDEQDEMILKMKRLWEDGEIPQSLTKELLKAVNGITDPIQVYYEIFDRIPERYFEERKTKRNMLSGDKQVILSSYLCKGESEA